MTEAAELRRTNREQLRGRMAGVFARREPRLQARKYVDGLIAELPRKNGWTWPSTPPIPDRMPRLLYRASSDETAAMGAVRDFVAEHPRMHSKWRCWTSPGRRRRASTPSG